MKTNQKDRERVNNKMKEWGVGEEGKEVNRRKTRRK